MKPFSIYPLAGIDNASKRDAALQVGGQERRTFLREALNVVIEDGRASMRAGLQLATSTNYADLWQSPLHGDTFARLGTQWVKVNTADWSHEVLAEVGEGALSHLVLNGAVLVAGSYGIYQYNGQSAQRLGIDTPGAPIVTAGSGSLEEGSYGVALSWLRGTLESPVSEVTHCAVGTQGALQVLLPMALDASVTGVRLYLTRQNGGELLRAGDYPASLPEVSIPLLPKLGEAARWRHMQAMPSGQYLGLWQGRLVVAQGRTLRFSQAMAYHVHDERHDFVQMPQRITFIAPVDGGIWVGQVDHVAFLRGGHPQELTLERKTAQAPVPGSLVRLTAKDAGELSGGGQAAVAWLSDIGFALGTPDGNIMEPQAKRLRGIAGQGGSTVVVRGCLLTAVS